MNKKPGFFQKAEQLLSGKGFYMVLLLCLVILGASGFFLYRTVSNLIPDLDEPASAQAEVTIPGPNTIETIDPNDSVDVLEERPLDAEPALAEEEALETAAEPEAQPVDAPAEAEAQPVAEQPEAEPVSEPVENVTVPVSRPVLEWPVIGEVVAAFSATELTYNEALGDWRTHGGVDIAADVGAEVLSAAAGTVESIVNEPLTGTTLTLRHDGDMTTVYGNLDGDTLCVAVGDTVEAGALLGNVGSASVENALPCLHFAVTVDGQRVDPSEYLG